MELAKPKSKRRAEKSNSQSIRKKKITNFDLSSCLEDGITQLSSARETQLFLA